MHAQKPVRLRLNFIEVHGGASRCAPRGSAAIIEGLNMKTTFDACQLTDLKVSHYLPEDTFRRVENHPTNDAAAVADTAAAAATGAAIAAAPTGPCRR